MKTTSKTLSVFFALSQTARVIDLDGEETRKPLRGIVTVESVEWAPCGALADLYFPDGSVAFDTPMRGAIVH